jgi:ankyrin repeat protein
MTRAILCCLALASVAHAAPPEELLAAVGKNDAATVGRMLAREPALANARNAAGESVSRIALFALQEDGVQFVPPWSNEVLALIVAQKPAWDLQETAALGDPPALAALLAKNPTAVSQPDKTGWTPLHYAAFAGNARNAELLLARGAEVDRVAANRFQNTPLLVALLTGDYATVEVLLAHRASVKARYERGTAPLHLAALGGNVELVKLLLAHGAELEARNDAGASALELATKGGRREVAAFLRARRATAPRR